MKKSEILAALCQIDGDLTFAIIAHNQPNITPEMQKESIVNLLKNQTKVQEIYFAVKNWEE